LCNEPNTLLSIQAKQKGTAMNIIKNRMLLLPHLATLFFLVLANQWAVAEECLVQKIEAENGVLGGKFMVVADDNVSGNGYISTPKESSWNVFDSNKKHFAKFEFELANDGQYRFDAMVFAHDDHSDSITVRVDKGDSFTWDLDSNSTWYIDSIGNKDGTDPMIFEMKTGSHILTLNRREVEAKVDFINIVKLNCGASDVL
jgi:hypothetical protein